MTTQKRENEPLSDNPDMIKASQQSLTNDREFLIRFWGVRGEIATPGEATMRYGGNTPCLEMRIGGKCLIFDGGTGLRELGNDLLRQMPVEAHIFFTHCHWDRIQGFPFFIPAFIPGNRFHIYGAEASNGASFEQRLVNQMRGPNFPVPIQVMRSELKFHDLNIGESQTIDDITIETSFLNYEHRSIGYRVNACDRSVVYATDTDNYSDHVQEKLLELAHQADLLILDAPDSSKVNHTSEIFWKISINLAKSASVKKVIISTHNPDHDDQFLEHIEMEVQSIFPHVSLAREGLMISLI
jgi:phosphoribosyl 1,2-cyclic phosphodiesterase